MSFCWKDKCALTSLRDFVRQDFYDMRGTWPLERLPNAANRYPRMAGRYWKRWHCDCASHLLVRIRFHKARRWGDLLWWQLPARLDMCV